MVIFLTPGDKGLNSRKEKKRPLARPSTRLLCLLGDYFLGHFLTYFLLSFSFFGQLEVSLVSFFGQASGLNTFSLGFFLYWHLITVLMRFFHTLLLGVTPFEYLAGLSNEGPWWWQRLAAGGRVIFGGIVDLFIVGNLPLLANKPSFKEVSLGCRLIRSRTRKNTNYRTFVFVCVAMVVAIFSPLVKDFNLLKTLVVSVEEVKKEQLIKGGDFSSYKTYKSEKFHLETFSSLANNRFSLYPDFEYIKIKNKKRVNPFLFIYDHEQRSSGELKVGHSLNLLELLKRGAYGNPLFRLKFPALYKEIHGPLISSKRRQWNEGQARKALLNEAVRKDIKKLIQASFELGKGRLMGHIFEYGPFLRGFIRLRETFLYLLKPGVTPEVDLIKMGSVDFLRFRQVFPKDLPFNKGVIETYVPIETPYSVSLMMGWDHSLPGALSAKTFRRAFLGDAKWYFDYSAVFDFPKEEKDMNPMVLLDFLSKDLKNQDKRELREEYLYQYYYHRVRELFKKGDKLGMEVIKNNMIRLSSLFEVKNSTKKNSFSNLFLDRWSELYSSLVREEITYFNL